MTTVMLIRFVADWSRVSLEGLCGATVEVPRE